MNGTNQNNGTYMPKSVNIINNGTKENPFKKSQEDKALLKKLKNREILHYRGVVLKAFSSIR